MTRISHRLILTAAAGALVAGLAVAQPAAADTGYKVKCSDDRTNTGVVIGAIAGGVAANQLFKDKDKKKGNALATVAGAVAGGYAGSKVACALNSKDRELTETFTSQTIETGTASEWSNPNSGLIGRAWVSGTTSQPSTYSLPVVAQRVATIPELVLTDGYFRSTGAMNVRSSPTTAGPVVAKLKKGETVSVVAKVSGGNWYLLEQNGVGIGYVSGTGLQALSATTLPARPPVSGTIENRTITVAQPCRIVTQVVNVKGKETTEQVTACYSSDGWKVV